MKDLDTIKNLFTPEQLDTLETWLFDEHLSVPEALTRVKKEFALQVSLDNLWYYFRRRARQRQMGELILAQLTANELNSLPVRVEDLRAAALKLVGTAALKFAIERPENVRGLESLTRLLLTSEDNDIKSRRLKLEERGYYFQVAAAIETELPRIKAFLADLASETNMTHDQKLDRMHELLFGGKCPRPDLAKIPAPAENATSPETPVTIPYQ